MNSWEIKRIIEFLLMNIEEDFNEEELQFNFESFLFLHPQVFVPGMSLFDRVFILRRTGVRMDKIADVLKIIREAVGNDDNATEFNWTNISQEILQRHQDLADFLHTIITVFRTDIHNNGN